MVVWSAIKGTNGVNNIVRKCQKLPYKPKIVGKIDLIGQTGISMQVSVTKIVVPSVIRP